MTTYTATAAIRTRRLLACLAVGYPAWAVVSLVQAATREGFDLTRHPLSALSNGSPGWIQIANFVVAGILAVLGAAGLRRAMAGTAGGRWAPRLVAVSGLGMVAAGVLVIDPVGGFPAGTPAPADPLAMSWHGIGHLVAGTVSFAALIAACAVLGHHYRSTGRPALAVASYGAATALLAGDVWAMTGGAAGSLTLAIGAITAMVWVAVAAARA